MTKYGLSETTVEKICKVFAEFPATEKAVLYGSRAKGNLREGSDIDLTLYGVALSKDLRSNIACARDDLMLPYTIDLSFFDSLNHAELKEHIERVGVLFYERKEQGLRCCFRRLPLNLFALKFSVGRNGVMFYPVSS